MGGDSPTLATGVATGGLGTAANLDDTQILRTAGLAEVEDEEAEAEVGPEVGPELVEPVVATVDPSPVPDPVRHVVARSGAGPGSHRARGLAGLLAAVLVVLAGIAVLTTRDEGTLGVGTVPSVGAAPTAEPTADSDDRDGKRKCKGKGRGNGNCDDGGGRD